MAHTHTQRAHGQRGGRRAGLGRRRGFTLIELMTVIFIIGLLVAILIPSLNAARNAAKKTSSAGTLKGIATGLEMFKADNGNDYRQTNGYPPSFAHPPILQAGGGPTFNPLAGEFPFAATPIGSSSAQPATVYGAHWLPAMLMGIDSLGVVTRSSVPPDLRHRPWNWYAQNAAGNAPLDRSPLYLDPTSIKTVVTEDLPLKGEMPPAGFFPDWQTMKHMPVIVDGFGQPVLYYVASTYGKTRNMLERERVGNNAYEEGVPYYFHQDNEGFTGNGDNEGGWNLGSGGHLIKKAGTEADAASIHEPEYAETFASFIHDGKAHGTVPTAASPLKPFNVDTYLLISAGRDARYGSQDDVTNFPLDSE